MKRGDRIAVVLGKEVTDNLRDRRSLGNMVLYVLIGPALTLLMIVVVGNIFREGVEKPLMLPIAGREEAPALAQFLEQNNVILQPAPDDAEQAVRNGDVEVVLVIPEGYGRDFKAGQPATVQLVVDTSRTSSMPSAERTRDLLRLYSGQIGALRLLARGVSPAIASALNVEQVDVSTPQSQGFLFLNMLSYLLVMTVFLGGSAAIIDATAGERERGSLEPLLINPVARWEFVIGKLLASLPFAVVSVLIGLAAFALIFNVAPVEAFIGMRLAVDLAALGGVFLISLPMILLASGVQMIIATFARTFKEAQTYTNWLPLVPALPGMVLAFVPVKPALWTMLIPTFGQQILINQLIRGEVVRASNVVVSTLVTLFLAGVLICIAIWLYSREQILFGQK